MLTWGHVLLNGLLAAFIYVLFTHYNAIFYGLMFDVAALNDPALSRALQSIPYVPLVPEHAITAAVLTASVLYAVAVDNTPLRALKGVLMGAIGVAAGKSMSWLLGVYYGAYLRHLVAFLLNPAGAVGVSLAALLYGAVTAMIALQSVVGAAALGFVIGSVPSIVSYVSYFYSALVVNPLRSALARLIAVFARRVHLGFLVPIGMYTVSVILFFALLPIAFLLFFWLLGILVGAIVALAALGVFELVVQAATFFLGALAATVLAAWTQRLFRGIPDEVVVVTSPVFLAFVLAIAAPLIAAGMLYALMVLPSVALVVSVALVASPTLRAGLERYVPMFTALFALQVLGLFASLLSAAGQAAGAAMAGMMYCGGINIGAQWYASSVVAPMEAFARLLGCAVIVVPYYDHNTGCFNFTAAPDSTRRAVEWLGAPSAGGPVFGEVPPWWWLDPGVWYNPSVWYEPTLWRLAAERGNMTYCTRGACYPHPWDAACNPYKKPYALPR
jgi:hypothetical protein